MIPRPSAPRRAVVPSELAGERLDRAATLLLGGGLSRSQLSRRIREGLVRVDGEVVTRTGFALASGQRLELAPLPEVEPEGALEPLVLYRDDWLVVLDKPAGLSMHGTHPGDPRPTVASFLERRFGPGLPTNQGAERPGIVHRLDRGTSGVCVAALEQRTFLDLMQQFRERSIEKEYLALCYGTPRFQSDWIEQRLMRDPRHPERMRVTRSLGPESRDATTYWELAEAFTGFCELGVRPRTGRMHQIRVHLSAAGLPLIGDALYRARNYGLGMLPPGAPPVRRPLLHAHRLVFEHPAQGGRVEFLAEPAEDYTALRRFLRVHAASPPPSEGR